MGDTQSNINAYRAKIGKPPLPRLDAAAVRCGVLKDVNPAGDAATSAMRLEKYDRPADAPFMDHGRPQVGKPRDPHKRRGRPPKGSGKRFERTGRDRYATPPGGPQNATEGEAAAAPTKGKRWVRVFDADADRIANSQAPELYCQALAVWYALIREASYRRSLTFEASDSYLSKRLPGMRSRHTVRKATCLLQSLGMLTSESRAVPGTKNREPLLRTLHPAAPMPGIGGADADPDGHGPQEAGELSFI